MSEKNYKFCVIEPNARGNDEVFRYMTDDELVEGFKCFETFADMKQFYLECLDEKVTKALKLKQKDVQ